MSPVQPPQNLRDEPENADRKGFSTGTNQKRKAIIGRKCGCHDCPYRSPDRKRHTDEAHVKDPVFAICCPHHGCHKVYFGGSSRDSEMEHHREGHEKENKGEKKGRRGIMPLSSYRLQQLP